MILRSGADDWAEPAGYGEARRRDGVQGEAQGGRHTKDVRELSLHLSFEKKWRVYDGCCLSLAAWFREIRHVGSCVEVWVDLHASNEVVPGTAIIGNIVNIGSLECTRKVRESVWCTR